MKVVVIEAFKGCKDGEVYPTDFEEGDTVEGNLAEIALENGWGEEIFVLNGSNVQPAVFEDGTQLGAVVQKAFDASNLSAEEWNALPEEELEKRIAAVVKKDKLQPPSEAPGKVKESND